MLLWYVVFIVLFWYKSNRLSNMLVSCLNFCSCLNFFLVILSHNFIASLINLSLGELVQVFGYLLSPTHSKFQLVYCQVQPTLLTHFWLTLWFFGKYEIPLGKWVTFSHTRLTGFHYIVVMGTWWCEEMMKCFLDIKT